MREIKFRVWNGIKIQHTVVVGELGTFFVATLDDQDSSSLSKYNTKYDDKCVVMQYTGLVDKNGTDVYEGDIVAYPEHYGGDYRHKPGVGTIVFDEAAFDIDAHTEGLVALCYNEGVEVIGNIYESPELLK